MKFEKLGQDLFSASQVRQTSKVKGGEDSHEVNTAVVTTSRVGADNQRDDGVERDSIG